MNLNRHLAIFSLIPILFFSMTVPVDGDSVYITTDKSIYQHGETINFSGMVNESASNEPVFVIVTDEKDDFVLLESSVSDAYGSYEINVLTDSKFSEEGLYSAKLVINDVTTNKVVNFIYLPEGYAVRTQEESSLTSQQPNSNFVEKISAEDIGLVDFNNNPINFASQDEYIQISSDLVNLVDENQLFVYIVQIKNQQGVPVSISWMTGVIGDDQTYNVSLSWTPSDEGVYTAQVFVWDSFAVRNVLSEPESIQIIVI